MGIKKKKKEKEKEKKRKEKETCFVRKSNPVTSSAMSVNEGPESVVFFRRPWSSLHLSLVTARSSAHVKTTDFEMIKNNKFEGLKKGSESINSRHRGLMLFKDGYSLTSS